MQIFCAKMQLFGFLTMFLLSQTVEPLQEFWHDLHSRPMFDVTYDYMEGQGQLLLYLEDYLSEDHQVALYDLVDSLDNPSMAENETTPTCDRCKAFFTLAKAAAGIYEWEEVRDTVVELCHMIISNISDGSVRTDVLCPGAMDLQGPHVFEIVKPKYRKSPETICHFLNGCLLPKDKTNADSKSSSQRIPPAQPSNDVTGVPQKLGQGDSGIKGGAKARKEKDHRSWKQRKDVGLKVVQFADIHIEPDYAEGSSTDCGLYVCCDIQYGPGTAGLYGDYKCNTPLRTVELFLEKAAEVQPDFILYTGDTPPHTFWDESLHSQLDVSTILVDAFKRILPGYRVYPSLGNHELVVCISEMYPTNLYSMVYLENYTAPMNEELTEMWSPLANFSTESEENMRQGGYYSELIRPGLRLLSFNTNYWYTFNWYNVLHEGTEEVRLMMDFIRDTFQVAQDRGEKVVLLGHHPVGRADTIILYSRMFEDLLSEYNDIIILHVAGHTHYDEFRVHSDSSGIPLANMFVCPSVTPKTDTNPSMRVYYLDDVTHELLDFEQYGFQLDSIQGTEEPNITFMYSAMEDYELEDMSASSWRDLIDRMATDDEVFDLYFHYFTTGYPNVTCDAECHRHHVCMSQYYSYDNIVYCENDISDGYNI